MSLTYIKSKSGPEIGPWGTPQETNAGRVKLIHKLTRNELLERQDLNQLTVPFEKSRAYFILQK